ncbi:hypothetical protein B0A53_00752 [Rhodotorula sp. CCFEE 5036]|nr:hypothetical protein B0A53_00752 [Rhodotorula sp. CCFEE 5036]
MMATARIQRRYTVRNCPLPRDGPPLAHDANAKSAVPLGGLISSLAASSSTSTGDPPVEPESGAISSPSGLAGSVGRSPSGTTSSAAPLSPTDPDPSLSLAPPPTAPGLQQIDPALLSTNTNYSPASSGDPDQSAVRRQPAETGLALGGSGDSDDGTQPVRAGSPMRQSVGAAQDGPPQKRKKAAHGQGKKRLARMKAAEKSARRSATKPRTRAEQIKSHHERTETLAHNFKQTCLDNGTFGILLLAHPEHLGRKKTRAMPYYKVFVSDEYESTIPTIPTDRINLSAILPEPASGNPALPPFLSPDALLNTIESLFAAHVQQAQERVYGLSIGQVQQSDELVRAANARAEASDKARRKMQRKLDRILAQVKRRKKKRVREGEEAESSDEESDESELSAGGISGEESE